MICIKGVFSPKQLTVLSAAVFSFFVLTYGFRLAGEREFAGVVMLLSAALIFPSLLLMKTTRITKGYWLVAFGAFVVFWHGIAVDSPTLSKGYQQVFQLIVQVFSLASAGAGGSIIASEGDKSATDYDEPSGRFTLTTDSKRILDLQDLTLKHTFWVKKLCCLVSVLIVVVLVVLMR